jgi:hypothetical protein
LFLCQSFIFEALPFEALPFEALLTFEAFPLHCLSTQLELSVRLLKFGEDVVNRLFLIDGVHASVARLLKHSQLVALEVNLSEKVVDIRGPGV